MNTCLHITKYGTCIEDNTMHCTYDKTPHTLLRGLLHHFWSTIIDELYISYYYKCTHAWLCKKNLWFIPSRARFVFLKEDLMIKLPGTSLHLQMVPIENHWVFIMAPNLARTLSETHNTSIQPKESTLKPLIRSSKN